MPSGSRVSPRLLTVALLAALVVGYSVWLAWSVDTNQWNDFAVYYLAGQLYAQHGDPYAISHPAWERLAAADGISHFAYPYRYPPPTAALVRLLLPLGPRAAALLWASPARLP